MGPSGDSPLTSSPRDHFRGGPCLPSCLLGQLENRDGAVESGELLPGPARLTGKWAKGVGVHVGASEGEQGWVTLGISLRGQQRYPKTPHVGGGFPPKPHRERLGR